jgi:hypothetical protein
MKHKSVKEQGVIRRAEPPVACSRRREAAGFARTVQPTSQIIGPGGVTAAATRRGLPCSRSSRREAAGFGGQPPYGGCCVHLTQREDVVRMTIPEVGRKKAQTMRKGSLFAVLFCWFGGGSFLGDGAATFRSPEKRSEAAPATVLVLTYAGLRTITQRRAFGLLGGGRRVPSGA